MLCANATLILIFSIFAIIAGIIVLAGQIFAAYIIKKLMHPEQRTNDILLEYEVREKKFDPTWLNIPFEKKELVSDFGYKLFGRLYRTETPSDKFIIDLHGHNSSSMSQLKYLAIFRELGYNVFMPDHRRSGYSEGKSVTFGHYEKYDAIKWIDMLAKENPNASFALFGESMGAATAMMVAAMDKRIKFLIEYCGYANMKELFLTKLNNRFVYATMKPFLAFAAYVLYGVRFKEINPLAAMKSLEIPVLIMHSRADKTVGVNNAYALMAANPNARTEIFENSRHARSLMEYPERFKAAIVDFVKDCENKKI